MKLKTICLLSFLSLFYACGPKTNDAPQNQCTSVTNIKANASVTVIENGKPFNFTADSAKGLSCTWQIPGLSASSKFTNTIPAVSFANEGWYKVEVQNTCGQIKKDSFYLDVTMPQGSPLCSPGNNTITYSAPNHTNGTFTTIQISPSSIPNDVFTFNAYGAGTDFTIKFHPKYRTNNVLPEDGVYTTGTFTSNAGGPFGEYDLDKIYIVAITYSPATIYYKSEANRKIYVSKVNEKLKVTFCDLPFTGSSNGTPYSTNISLSATVQ